VVRIIKWKGPAPSVDGAWPLVIGAMPYVRLLVVGDAPEDALLRVDSEADGFSMVAIEAVACGTPTLAFPVYGIVDAVAGGVNGRMVQEGDYGAFGHAVIAIIRGGPPAPSQCRAHASNFGWDKHQQKLLSIIKSAAQPQSGSLEMMNVGVYFLIRHV